MKSIASWAAAALLVCGFSAAGYSADLVVTKTQIYTYDVCLILAQQEAQRIIAVAALHPLLKTGDPEINAQAEQLRDERRAIYGEERDEHCI